jgi:tetratricopeptide (TPR) repeat protein
LGLFIALAVTVPAVVLDRAAGEERRTAELTAAPFAWRNVLILHLVAALPLGLAAAGWLRTRPMIAHTARFHWVMLGGVTTALYALAIAPALGRGLATEQIDFAPLLVLRAFLAFALVLPWCVAALDAPSADQVRSQPLLVWSAGLGLALVPCALYVERITIARAEEAATLLGQERLVRADWVVRGLCELGSERRVGKMTTFEARRWLAAEIPPLLRQADQRLPAGSPPEARIHRAVALVKVERLDEAAALLRPLTPANDAATAMLAAIYRNQERWAESDALYQGLLAKLLPQVRSNEQARRVCEAAFDGLAESARAERRFGDAEAVLTRGLRELPGDSANLHFLLGRTYRDEGRFDLAVEELQTAARLDPASFAKPADDIVQQLRTSSLGCLTNTHRGTLGDRP